MWVNVFLGAFNLLPAFPMDGGRVLRALLSMRLGRTKATRLAASIGQGMAILFGIAGFFGNPMLIFIAIFVYLGAEAEARAGRDHFFHRRIASQGCDDDTLPHAGAEDSLETAIHELLAGSQQDFPVMADGNVGGILRRNDLVQALAHGRREERVSEVMCRTCGIVAASDPLEKTLERMSREGCATLAVMDGKQTCGIVDAGKHR